MQTLTQTLITVFIIFSIASVAGQRKARINMAENPILVLYMPVSANAKCYHSDMESQIQGSISDKAAPTSDAPIGKASLNNKSIRKIASRKKTATKTS